MRISARQSVKILKSQKAGKLIGYLFLIIGLGALIHLAKVTIDERAARHWVPHTAQIERASLETHENDKGSKTYSINVTYLFDWNGRAFKGTQYRLHDKSSPNLKENDEIVQDLLRAKREDVSYPIFVNPKNPQQSAIKNVVHPKTKTLSRFLGLLFSVIGYFTAFEPKFWSKKGAQSNSE